MEAGRECKMSSICWSSPVSLREHAAPRHPEELSAHQCITYVSGRTGRVMDWEFERAGQKIQLTLDGVLAVNDQDGNIIAGLMGIGSAKVTNYIASPDLESCHH